MVLGLFLANPISMLGFTPAVALLTVAALVYAVVVFLAIVLLPDLHALLHHLVKWVLPHFFWSPHKALFCYMFIIVRYVGGSVAIMLSTSSSEQMAGNTDKLVQCPNHTFIQHFKTMFPVFSSGFKLHTPQV